MARTAMLLEQLAKLVPISKTYPSFLTVKEGSTSHLGLLPSGKKEENRPTRRSEPLRSKVGGQKRSAPSCAGWDRLE